MTWIAGVDGCRQGWCVALANLDTGARDIRIVRRFADVLALPEAPDVICVDMPIGLPDATPAGGRDCERDARAVLGPRRSSVFSTVGRKALDGRSQTEATRLSRAGGGGGISAQAWGLSGKLREVDAAMTPELQSRVYEVHPELCFWAMNGRAPMTYAKTTRPGAEHRRDALIGAGKPEDFIDAALDRTEARVDDVLDACAALWTARRIHAEKAERMPGSPVHDARGLDMAIWF
jgi:predicted RNase H-like nuclease